MQENEHVKAHGEEQADRALSSSHLLTMKGKAEMGFVGGLVASIVAAFVAIASDGVGLLISPWFVTLGSVLGVAGLPAYVGLVGVVAFLTIGVVWGLIFAFLFSKYSVTKGLAFSGIQILLTVALLMVVSTPQVGGTLLTLPIVNSLMLVIGLAFTYIAFGVVIGLVGRKYTGLP